MNINDKTKMKKTKIEELYYSFSKNDLEGILQLLQCKTINNLEILITIHQYFCSRLNKDELLDKMELYALIYGKKETFSDLKLRVYLSKLVKFLEKYIVLKNYETYPIAELNILNNYYKLHHLDKCTSLYFSSQSEMKFQSYEEKLLFDYQYSLRHLDFIITKYSNDMELSIKSFEETTEKQHHLDTFMLIKGLCEYMNISQKYKFEKDISKEELKVLELLNNREELNEITQAYLSVYMLLKNSNEDEFLKLKDLVLNEKISKYDLNNKAIIIHLQNFCVKMFNIGKNNYLEHYFDINNYSLKFYINSGDLTSVNYRNIVYCALQLKKIEWAESFVENYLKKVNEVEQENAFNFNYARIYFEKKEYKNSMRKLLQVTYEDPFYASSARILLIKCYFVLDDTNPLLSCCSSLNQFLNRNKSFTPQRIENYLHFIKFIKSIHNHRLSGNKKYYKQLIEKIKQSTVVEKEWLLSKIETLML